MTHTLVEERLQPKQLKGKERYAPLSVVGVAAAGLGPPNERVSHCALLYRWKKKEVRSFEMLSHEQLSDEVVRREFVWVEPRIQPSVAHVDDAHRIQSTHVLTKVMQRRVRFCQLFRWRVSAPEEPSERHERIHAHQLV